MQPRFHGYPIFCLGVAGLVVMWLGWDDSRSHRSYMTVQESTGGPVFEVIHWNRQWAFHLIRPDPAYRTSFSRRSGEVQFVSMPSPYCGTGLWRSGAKGFSFQREKEWDAEGGIVPKFKVVKVPGLPSPGRWSVSIHLPYWLLTLLYLVVWPRPWLYLRWRGERHDRQREFFVGASRGGPDE